MVAPTERSPLGFRTLLRGALVATALLTAACGGDDGPGKLFDEDGVWELTQFALEGSGIESVSNTRSANFFLKFDNANRVVQTAMCANRENADPTNSECRGFTDAQWNCQCFGYDFEGDQMAWQQFDAGGEIPVVQVGRAAADDEAPAETDGETDGAGAEDDGAAEPAPEGSVHEFTVAEVNGVGSTYDLTPLPAGVFGSDGSVSRFIFQAKAPSQFDQVLENDEVPVCQPCI